MFNYAQNITYTSTDASITMATDTFSQNGTISRLLKFGKAGSLTLNFTALTGQTEISFYLYSPGYLLSNPLTITINSKVYSVPYFRGWRYFIFAITASIASIQFTSSDVYQYFIDVLGGRVANENTFNDDIANALKSAISMTPVHTTTISTIDKPNRKVTFADSTKIFDKSMLEFSHLSTAENIQMINSGMFTSMSGTFVIGDTVRTLCPVQITNTLEFPDPGIGIEIVGNNFTQDLVYMETKDGQYKAFEYSPREVYLLLRCSNRAVYEILEAEFVKKYSNEFFMLYDGRRVHVKPSKEAVFQKDEKWYNAMLTYSVEPSLIRTGTYYNTTDYRITAQSQTIII